MANKSQTSGSGKQDKGAIKEAADKSSGKQAGTKDGGQSGASKR